MTKVYELIYENYDNECGYYQVALSLDKSKLQVLIDKAKAFDEQYEAENQKWLLDDDYDPNFDLPIDFPLWRCDWFDKDVFWQDHYDGDCVKNFKIVERTPI